MGKSLAANLTAKQKALLDCISEAEQRGIRATVSNLHRLLDRLA